MNFIPRSQYHFVVRISCRSVFSSTASSAFSGGDRAALCGSAARSIDRDGKNSNVRAWFAVQSEKPPADHPGCQCGRKPQSSHSGPSEPPGSRNLWCQCDPPSERPSHTRSGWPWSELQSRPLPRRQATSRASAPGALAPTAELRPAPPSPESRSPVTPCHARCNTDKPAPNVFIAAS